MYSDRPVGGLREFRGGQAVEERDLVRAVRGPHRQHGPLHAVDVSQPVLEAHHTRNPGQSDRGRRLEDQRTALVEHHGEADLGDGRHIGVQPFRRAQCEIGRQQEDGVRARLRRGPGVGQCRPQRPARACDHGYRTVGRRYRLAHHQGLFSFGERVQLARATGGEDTAGPVLQPCCDMRAQNRDVHLPARVERSGREEEHSRELHVISHQDRSGVDVSRSSVRQLRPGRQPSSRSALAVEKAGFVPVRVPAHSASSG